MLKPEVVLTVYRVRIDASTAKLLGPAPIYLNSIRVSFVDEEGGSYIAYTLATSNDNEYTHKAIGKRLREAIKAAK